MSIWVEKFEQHKIHKTIAQLEVTFSDLQDISDDAKDTVRDGIDRVIQVVSLTSTKLKSLDPLLTPLPVLNEINSLLQNFLTELNNYKSNNNPAHVNNAHGHVDSLLVCLGKLPSTETVEDIEGIQEAIIAFRKSSEAHLKGVKSKTTQLQNEINKQSSKLKELIDEINSQKGRLDTAISQYQQQFSDSEENRRKSFSEAEEKRESKASDSLKAIKERIDKIESESTAKYKDVINNAIESFENTNSKLNAQTSDAVSTIESHKEHAEKLISVITNTGMIGGFQTTANSERRSARLWQFFAWISLCGIIGFAFYAFLSSLEEDIKWGVMLAKVFVAAAFGIAAAYAARQADKHEQAERKNRRMELELASIDPYLITLPEETRHKIKEDLASRLFAQQDDTESEKLTKVSGSTLDLVRMALESIDNLAKKR